MRATDRERFLGECDSPERECFAALLDRLADLGIHVNWGSRGFSIGSGELACFPTRAYRSVEIRWLRLGPAQRHDAEAALLTLPLDRRAPTGDVIGLEASELPPSWLTDLVDHLYRDLVQARREASGLIRELFSESLQEIRPYFERPQEPVWLNGGGTSDPQKWLARYHDVATRAALLHDEPWVTLVSLFALFGDHPTNTAGLRLEAVNELFAKVYRQRHVDAGPCFSEITGVWLEVQLPVNERFGHYLRQKVFTGDAAWHPYADHQKQLEGLLGGKAPLEGGTHVDAVVGGKDVDGHPQYVFLEAKFLSDMSTEVSYLPVRNQVARTIDCGLTAVVGKEPLAHGLAQFWFMLLTPSVFRPPSFGGGQYGCLKPFEPWRGRFYALKMEDYLTPDRLRADLPHLSGELDDQQWLQLSQRIGWATFEELAEVSLPLVPVERQAAFERFFDNRGMHVGAAVLAQRTLKARRT